MRKAFSKVLILHIAMVLLIGSFAIGCTNQDSDQPTGSPGDGSSEKETDSTNDSKPVDAKPEEKKPVTLTYFWDMDAKASMSMKSYEEIACFKKAISS